MTHFKDMDDLEWRRFGHIPVLIILQVCYLSIIYLNTLVCMFSMDLHKVCHKSIQ